MNERKIVILTLCQNQEKEIEFFSKKIISILKKSTQNEQINENSFLCFIDNASKDNSWYSISKENVRNTDLIKAYRLQNKTKRKTIIDFIGTELKKINIEHIIVVGFDNNENEIINTINSLKNINNEVIDIEYKSNSLKDTFKELLYQNTCKISEFI